MRYGKYPNETGRSLRPDGVSGQFRELSDFGTKNLESTNSANEMKLDDQKISRSLSVSKQWRKFGSFG